MKRLLSIIGAISLVGTSTTSLVACNTPQEYTPEELAKLKEENKIDTANQEIKDKLEWIAPQEKPFNKVDDKWYYVVWRGNKNKWNLLKFQNNEKITPTKENNDVFKSLDKQKENKLKLHYHGNLYAGKIINSDVDLINYESSKKTNWPWRIDKGIYFKAVYRWNLNTQEPNLIIDNDGNVKVNGE